MIAHRQLPSRAWMLIVTVVLLFSVHGLVFYLLRHLALSGTVISGLIILILIQHLGAFRSLRSLALRRGQTARDSLSRGIRRRGQRGRRLQIDR